MDRHLKDDFELLRTSINAWGSTIKRVRTGYINEIQALMLQKKHYEIAQAAIDRIGKEMEL